LQKTISAEEIVGNAGAGASTSRAPARAAHMLTPDFQRMCIREFKRLNESLEHAKIISQRHRTEQSQWTCAQINATRNNDAIVNELRTQVDGLHLNVNALQSKNTALRNANEVLVEANAAANLPLCTICQYFPPTLMTTVCHHRPFCDTNDRACYRLFCQGPAAYLNHIVPADQTMKETVAMKQCPICRGGFDSIFKIY
jgi:hypothetical protein